MPCAPRRLLAALLISEGCAGPAPAAGDSTTAAITGSESAPVDCEQYVSDTTTGPAVTITVRHTGGAPVYFHPQGCGAAIGFDITALASDEVVRYDLGECSPVLCDDFVGAADCNQGCNDCAVPDTARLDPDGMGVGTWPGTWLVPLEMVEQCAGGAGCQTTCLRRDLPPPGFYEFALTVYRVCAGTCECDAPEPDGLCTLSGGAQIAYPQTYTTVIDYPAQNAAEIVIGD